MIIKLTIDYTNLLEVIRMKDCSDIVNNENVENINKKSIYYNIFRNFKRKFI